MSGLLHEELARQRHRETQLDVHRVRVGRAADAARRARRAVEVAVRAAERAEASRGESHRLPAAVRG